MIEPKKHPLFLIAFFIILVFSYWSLDVQGRNAKTILKIKSQTDFDCLRTKLHERIVNGDKNIVVEFAKGKYYYKTQHVFFTDIHYPELSVRFKGNGATIISAGRDLEVGGAAVDYLDGAGFVDSKGRDFHNYSRVFQADTLIEILDVNLKQCRIHCPELGGVSNVDCTNAYIRVTSWFTSYLYRVSKIADDYVYFTADNLALGYPQYGNYNINYDYTVGKILPRFRLVNLPLGGCEIVSTAQGLVNKSSERFVHQCEAGFFIFFQNCELKHLMIEGFNIIGCRANCQVFRFRSLKAESILLNKTTLSAARGFAIYAESTDNITIRNCEFHDNYKDVISFSNTCDNTVVNNNKFYNNGKGIVNSFCIICRGGNYLIKNNDIRDFNYGAIGVGVWYKASEGSKPSYGVVERNHIYYSSPYIADKALWTMVDGGAIYAWTKNDGAVIRHNFIHDYDGMDSNRGIYCDDGANNCSIYGNIILNIGNCRSIDLRRSKTMENAPVGQRSNENNHIFANVFNNQFLFEGRDNDSTSVVGGNIILVNSEDGIPKITLNNVIRESQDKILKYNEKVWYKKGRRLIR